MRECNGELKLLLNLNQGSRTLEECWMEGFHQANIQVGEECNPYQVGSCEREQWAEGWWAGFYGEEALYPEYAVGLAVELEEAVMERQLEESEMTQPSYQSIANFLIAMGATASACVLGSVLICF